MKNKVFSLLSLLCLLALRSPAVAEEITPAGQQLIKSLDSMKVETLWLAGQRVNWRTGEAEGPYESKNGAHTHCSAFAAAAAEKLGVYLLHPPEHSTILLANAQQDWLRGAGTNQGWRSVSSAKMAQHLANQGELVVVTCKNPDPKSPGHIAIVRPSTKSDAQIIAEGPQITQAGGKNYADGNAKAGFRNHKGAFENNELIYFVHPLKPVQTAG